MYQGYTESPEKIARRKARICSGAQKRPATVPTETEGNSRALVDNMRRLIEQARGELDIRKLYARPVTP